MRRTALSVGVLLAVSVLPAYSVTPPKAGSVCSKQGVTKTYIGKKYTCLKIGKKLVWSKGVTAKKSAPTPIPSPISNPLQPSAPTSSTSPSNQPPREVPEKDKPCVVEDVIGQPGRSFACLKNEKNQLVWHEFSDKSKFDTSLEGKKCITPGEGLTYNNSFFRCIPFDSNTGELAWEWIDPNMDNRAYGICKSVGEEIYKGYYSLKCGLIRGPLGFWRISFNFNTPKPSTNDSKYAGRAEVGKVCDMSGDRFDFSGYFLECRYTNGQILKWVRINNVKKELSNPISPVAVEACRLKEKDISFQSWRNTDLVPAFPKLPREGLVNPGKNKILLVGVDFPELKGGPELTEKLAFDKKIMTEWFNYFSNGKVSLDITTFPKWIRSAKPQSAYRNPNPTNFLLDHNSQDARYIGQPLIDVVTTELDLRDFTIVLIIHPDGASDFVDGSDARGQLFKIKEGETRLSVFNFSASHEFYPSERWVVFIHEMLHGFGVVGHAPGQGWPFGIMQGDVSYALGTWDQFLMNWLPDTQVYCTTSDNLKQVEISLSPIEREDSQLKVAFVKLSPTKMIAIEAHAIDKWSSFNTGGRKYPPGFAAAMVYLIDLEQAGAPWFGADGGSLSGDKGNDPNFKKWAYWQKIDGQNSFVGFSFNGIEMGQYIGMLGDSFTVEGVRVEVIGTGDFETVKISKL